MLDPRIYRSGLAVIVLAVLVLAFSLGDQQSALTSTLAPDAFNGQNVYAQTARLASRYPQRAPGSAGDQDLANEVSRSLGNRGFTVSTDTFSGQTADGARSLQNVVAVRPGSAQSGSIVIVAHRDARGSPATAALSGTATLMELGRDLAGESLQRTVVLASTTGAQGTAGALRLASTLAGPIDAVVVLGDLASRRIAQPVVVPWSTSPNVASPGLRNTLEAELAAQASLSSTQTSLFGQYLHLAFPLTLSEQAPFGDRGVPAVYVSLSGERGAPPGGTLAAADQVNAIGRALLATVSALDSGPAVPPASAYLLLSGKVVPGWALSLFVLTLLVPVVMTAIDALARARRRGHRLGRWIVVAAAAAVPFLLFAAVIRIARLTGSVPIAPTAPVGPGTVPAPTGAWVMLILAALLAVAATVVLRSAALHFAGPGARPPGPGRETAGEGAVAALLAVTCLVIVSLWLINPYAALLVAPGLHLWLLALSPDLRLRVAPRLLLILISLAPLVLVPLYYATTLGYTPLGLIWTVTLLIAGHGVGLIAVVAWSLFGGCVLTALGVLVALARQPRPEQQPVTVRGPVSYAGPGSLGGTESALRR